VLTAAGVKQWAHLSSARASKAFARFMKKSRRSQTNPLEDMGKVSTIKRGRRALSRAEVEWLITTTQSSPTMSSPDWGCNWQATGAERALIYALVCCTGLRAKEARGLRVRDFRLEVDPPHLVVGASLAKNRTANTVPLPGQLAAELKRHIKMKMPDAVALPVPNRAAWMLRNDMAAARIAYIEAAKNGTEQKTRTSSPFLEVARDTDRFLPIDFHSLRGTASVLLQQAGVPIGFVQRILNHKTPLITIGNDTNPDLDTLAQKMNAVPSLAIAAM
jgi:integrase